MSLWDVFTGRAEGAHKPWAEKTPEHHLIQSWSTTAQSLQLRPPHIPSLLGPA